MDNDNILEISGIAKSFGSTRVLKDIHLTVAKGSVHAICGENGAGKSTLMKILSGVYRPDHGSMRLNDHPYAPANPEDGIRAGISMIYQELNLAEHLTVAENIFLGQEILSPHSRFVLDIKAMNEETAKLIRHYGFSLSPTDKIEQLSVASAQIVELLKALHRDAKIIVMDEPTSSLSEKESRQLFNIIHNLKNEHISVLYISHRMEEIRQLADTVSILRDGEMIKTAPIQDISTEEIIRYMVGRDLSDFYPKRNVTPGEVLFSVGNLTDHAGIADIDFSIHAGEVVGFSGLVGAGRTEVANAIFGVSEQVSGTIQLHGKTLHIKNPADAIRAGIAYLTEDRKRTGLCANLPCFWNITLPNFDHLGMHCVIHPGAEREQAVAAAERVRTKWNSPDEPVANLSGGNQQKLLLARWLMAESTVLIFDEPTRGIDIGAKKEFYTLLNQLAESGKAVLLISSDLPEIFGVCDRVLVMRQGRITADLPVRETTPEEVMKYAATELKTGDSRS